MSTNWLARRSLRVLGLLLLSSGALAQEPEVVAQFGSFSYVTYIGASGAEIHLIEAIDFNEEQSLIFYCDAEGILKSYATSVWPLGLEHSLTTVPIRYRFADAGEFSAEQEWAINPNNRFANVPDAELAAWVEKTRAAEVLVIRMPGFQDTIQAYYYELDGFSEAFANLPCATE